MDKKIRGTAVCAMVVAMAPAVVSAQDTMEMESTTYESYTTGMWDIDGPITLRSTDPVETGVLEVKNEFGWSTSRGSSDDFSYELILEYGIAEGHELLIDGWAWELGDGRVEGNGDVTLGWHWRLTDEEDWMPSFALRSFVRVPTGYHSEGVDYELRPIFTKTIDDNSRFHFNPYVGILNGDNGDPDPDDDFFGDSNQQFRGHFYWGFATGMDYKLSDEFLLVWDYIYEGGRVEGEDNQHAFEVGFDWTVAEGQKIGFVTEVGLDGDRVGPALGATVSYIMSFGG